MRRRQDPKAKAAMIAIEALTALAFGLAVVTTANVIRAHAADDDLLPRAGETPECPRGTPRELDEISLLVVSATFNHAVEILSDKIDVAYFKR
jgi:hypothetical protein